MSTASLRALGLTAAVLAATSIVAFGIALGFAPSTGEELVDLIVTAGPGDADALRLGALADMLGFYLLPAVLAVALRRRLPWSSDVVADVATVAGVMYGAIGAIGAAVLAAAAPALIEQQDAQSAAILEALARVVEGLWQWLEALPFAVWMGGLALSLREERPGWAVVFGALSCSGALVWVGRSAGIEGLVVAALAVWFALFPAVLLTLPRWVGERAEAAPLVVVGS